MLKKKTSQDGKSQNKMKGNDGTANKGREAEDACRGVLRKKPHDRRGKRRSAQFLPLDKKEKYRGVMFSEVRPSSVEGRGATLTDEEKKAYAEGKRKKGQGKDLRQGEGVEGCEDVYPVKGGEGGGVGGGGARNPVRD